MLSDRYQDATRAYQGAARGIPQHEIEQLTQTAGNSWSRTKRSLFDLAPEVGLARARLRNAASPAAAAEGRFEAEDLAFHKRVREAYLDLAIQLPSKDSYRSSFGNAG